MLHSRGVWLWTPIMAIAVLGIVKYRPGSTEDQGERNGCSAPQTISLGAEQPLPRIDRVAAQNGGVAFCFAPGTSEKQIARYNQLLELDQLNHPDFYTTTRWSGSQGTPRALTWSFVPDGLSVDGETNELFSRMDSLFASLGGRATWIAQFDSIFNRWAALTGTSYTRIKFNGNDWDDGAAFSSATPGNANRGDIRIAMTVNDGAFNILAYNYYPSNGDMVLDRDENWASSSNSFRFLRNTLMHEHGHGLGLQHVCPSNQTKLMEPFLNTGFDGPQHDDIRGGQRHYGDAFEENDTAATATNMGTVTPGSPVSVGAVPAPAVTNGSLLSIDATGDQDFFRFTIGGPRMATVTIVPLGLSYDSSTQNGDSSCNSGTTVNSLSIADLNVQIIGTDGSTVLSTGAAQPAGSTESLSNITLPSSGQYYLKVYAANTISAPQAYTLTLSTTNVDCNENGVPDATDIANGTSKDCNGNAIPDECDGPDIDGDNVLDACEYAHADLDLDGDVDVDDFGLLQRCFTGTGGTVTDPACFKARLDTDGDVDQADLNKLLKCLSGSGVPYPPTCNQ